MEELLEAISPQAELLELTAINEASAQGVSNPDWIEVADQLRRTGSERPAKARRYRYCRRILRLRQSDVDDAGSNTKQAGPSQPVELLGLNGTPGAGDDFAVVSDERSARELAEFRRDKLQERLQATQQAAKLDNMFANMIEGEKRILKLVVKTDVRGSLEAIIQAMSEIGNEEVSVQVLGSGVGGISESDATMAATYGATVFGFNVRADKTAKTLLERGRRAALLQRYLRTDRRCERRAVRYVIARNPRRDYWYRRSARRVPLATIRTNCWLYGD